MKTQSELDEFNPEAVTICIFNIAFLHSKDRRIRRPSEMIEGGVSRFEWLSEKNDLVVFMDEAHRYRASAATRTLDELQPVLGIELTATPQIQTGKSNRSFQNIIYRFQLREALLAGFVKRLGICCRGDFDCSTLSESELGRLKLEDGLAIHKYLKVQLDDYTHQMGLKEVKPFVLVITRDTSHADQMRQLVESSEFMDGRYKGKVLTVHSETSGEEKEETVRQLLEIESPENPIEIVIHVNMLREGWDVKNLYTIIPLRSAHSRTLIEQSLGRGARLPFGKRTGIDVIDRLYIVSHERFDKVAAEAEEYLDFIDPINPKTDIPKNEFQIIEVAPKSIQKEENENPSHVSPIAGNDIDETFLQTEKIISPSQTIQIPRITISPDPDAKPGQFLPFNLSLEGYNLRPTDSPIKVFDPLAREKTTTIHSKLPSIRQGRWEEKIASELLHFDDVAETECHADLVLNLAKQMTAHLGSYFDKESFEKVLHTRLDAIVKEIHRQMQTHYESSEEKWQHTVGKGFLTFDEVRCSLPQDQAPLHYTEKLNGKNIGSVVWSGFQKSIYPMIKFDSSSELDFAKTLESDDGVLTWVKTPKGKFGIFYCKDKTYEPDFVVETCNGKYLCEVKARKDLQDKTVKEKARSALQWCQIATEYSDKPWKYLLIPHDEVKVTSSFAGHANRLEWKDL